MKKQNIQRNDIDAETDANNDQFEFNFYANPTKVEIGSRFEECVMPVCGFYLLRHSAK